VDKRRISPDEAAVEFLIGDVKGRNVLLVDDMITTAGSITSAARLLKQKGAKEIYAAAAHGVLCGPAVERLSAAPIKEIVVTDSIPMNAKAQALGDHIKVLTVSELLGESVRRIHSNQSISSLFMRQ